MAALSPSPSLFSSSSSPRTPPSPPPHFPSHLLSSSSTLSLLRFRSISTSSSGSRPRQAVLLACASSSSLSGDLNSRDDGSSPSKKTLLSDFIQEIEPLDVTLIQRDVPPTTIEAMKRTISGMLGLLPSNQFQVLVEALWESLSKLLISSMMTGYTLRNAEYRLCLERNLDIHDDDVQHDETKAAKVDVSGILLDSVKSIQVPGENFASSKSGDAAENPSEVLDVPDLGEMSPEAQSFILHLQSRMSSINKELHEVEKKCCSSNATVCGRGKE